MTGKIIQIFQILSKSFKILQITVLVRTLLSVLPFPERTRLVFEGDAIEPA